MKQLFEITPQKSPNLFRFSKVVFDKGSPARYRQTSSKYCLQHYIIVLASCTLTHSSQLQGLLLYVKFSTISFNAVQNFRSQGTNFSNQEIMLSNRGQESMVGTQTNTSLLMPWRMWTDLVVLVHGSQKLRFKVFLWKSTTLWSQIRAEHHQGKIPHKNSNLKIISPYLPSCLRCVTFPSFFFEHLHGGMLFQVFP